MARDKLQALKFGHDLWDPSHRFETSWLLPPWGLFAVRAIIVSTFTFRTIYHEEILEHN
jgi:hypothetical protein